MQKKYRLQNFIDYAWVYRNGCSYANHQLVLYVLVQPKVDRFRVGISASKKIGNAVVRNRLRRIIKEIVRHQADRIANHIDLVFIVRKGAVNMDYKKLAMSVHHVMCKASILT